MNIKTIRNKTKKFFINPYTSMFFLGVSAGLCIALVHYENQTTLNLSDKAVKAMANGDVTGYEVNGVQYLLVQHPWK